MDHVNGLPHNEATHKKVLVALAENKSITAVALELGMSRGTVRKIRDLAKLTSRAKSSEFTLPTIPDPERSVDEIFEHRKTVYNRIRNHAEATSIFNVAVNIDGPIAIAHFGDPHLDDDGCDLQLFRKHCDVVHATEGMFAGNIGDIINNWVGRLERLHGNQTTTAAEAWKLAEWMFEYIPWLYVIAGNHDCWSGNRDPLKWISKNLGQPYINHGTRLKLNFPNGRNIMVNIAHDYKGHSQWNPVHGAMKKGRTWPDDIFVCGHRHHTAVSMNANPVENKAQWFIRVDSYKVFDDYPKEIGIDETFISPCVVTIINPDYESERDKVLVCLDPEQAAFILTKMREKWKNDRK